MADEIHVAVPTTKEMANSQIRAYKVRNHDPSISREIVSIQNVEQCFVHYRNCIWFRYSLQDGRIIDNNFWFVPSSYMFQFKNGANHKNGFRPLQWNSLDWKGTGDGQTSQYYHLDPTFKSNPALVLEAQPDCLAFDGGDLDQPMYNFNDSKPNIHKHGKSCTPGPQAYAILQSDKPSEHMGCVRIADGLIAAEEYDFNGCQNSDFTRWAVMGLLDPDTTARPQEWAFSHMHDGTTQLPDGYESLNIHVEQGLAEAHLQCKVQRGFLGTEQKQYEATASQYQIHQPFITNDVTPNLKYELNVLLEYSNSQVLMSKTREIPIHVSNLVPKT